MGQHLNRPVAAGFGLARPPAASSDFDVYAHLRANLARHLSDDVQYELARLLRVRELARSLRVNNIEERAQAAVAALLSEVPQLTFARTVRYRLEMELLAHNGRATRFLVRQSQGNPVMIVGMGALLTLLLWFVLLGLGLSPVDIVLGPPAILQNDRMVAIAAEAAFLGGVVSVLSRFKGFAQMREFDPVALFLSGMLKPYVGMVFALFIYAFYESGLLTLKAESMPNLWWVLGFLAGFSERVPRDIISRGEGILGK